MPTPEVTQVREQAIRLFKWARTMQVYGVRLAPNLLRAQLVTYGDVERPEQVFNAAANLASLHGKVASERSFGGDDSDGDPAWDKPVDVITELEMAFQDASIAAWEDSPAAREDDDPPVIDPIDAVREQFAALDEELNAVFLERGAV
jgi:hypothetical protein